MHNPIELLLNEHEIIVKAIESARNLEVSLKNNPVGYKTEMKKYIDFFKSYADGFHHHKEEQILFPEMSKKNELLGDGVIMEMLNNHEEFRESLSDIVLLIEEGELNEAIWAFNKYAEALLDHISVENDEVFQMAETLLDEAELEKIYFKFKDYDAEMNSDLKLKLEKIINSF